ncbi:hypothetical protein PACTADRAFT_50793 [Pachysolen tannophilus NRRL Y-2460]|uniref:Uncharacterized protein n=1 Tax=Pachysolen tannophilus NRRL Y-2460 TaxID=669874 RepID=A0A1E4TTA7_PACTA|nr:hypothetical protein PACTADRAFT_50793 [Pachysolen tannophilus NRRL Y-2460]
MGVRKPAIVNQINKNIASILTSRSLRNYDYFDLRLDLNVLSRTELNFIGKKSSTINFPKLIKRSLLNLPETLNEKEYEKNIGFINDVRTLYYSGLDKDVFKYLIDENTEENRGLIIDNAYNLFYSDIAQLKKCYQVAMMKVPYPQGEIRKKKILQKNLKLHEFNDNNSLLFELIKNYDKNNYTLDVLLNNKGLKIDKLHSGLPYFNQLSSLEKSKIFGFPKQFPARIDPNYSYYFHNLYTIINASQRYIMDKNELGEDIQKAVKPEYDHLILRGYLIYSEVIIDDMVMGCGLDYNHHWSSQRAARQALINPLFKEWLLNYELKESSRYTNKFLKDRYEKKVKELFSPILQEIADKVKKEEEQDFEEEGTVLP